MNQTKFMEVIQWSKEQLWLHCKELTEKYGHLASTNILMTLRRDIQKGLADYSKNKNEIDIIQDKAIMMTESITKWCGQYYKTWAMKQILKRQPDLVFKRQKLKGLTGQAWEEYVRKFSY